MTDPSFVKELKWKWANYETFFVVLQATQHRMIYYCSLMNANGNICVEMNFFLFSRLKYLVSPRKMWAMECTALFLLHLWFTKMWWWKHNSIKVKSNSSFCSKHISNMIRSSINNHKNIFPFLCYAEFNVYAEWIFFSSFEKLKRFIFISTIRMWINLLCWVGFFP